MPPGAEPARRQAGGAGNGEMEVPRRDCHGRQERADTLRWVEVVFWWGRGQREEEHQPPLALLPPRRRRPCGGQSHREGFSAGCRLGFCTVSLRYYFYGPSLRAQWAPHAETRPVGLRRVRPGDGPARPTRAEVPRRLPRRRPAWGCEGTAECRASSLAASPLVLLCGVGGFVVFFFPPEGEREGG